VLPEQQEFVPIEVVDTLWAPGTATGHLVSNHRRRLVDNLITARADLEANVHVAVRGEVVAVKAAYRLE
jgi:hypothetical protein